jgi:hypothetical protein
VIITGIGFGGVGKIPAGSIIGICICLPFKDPKLDPEVVMELLVEASRYSGKALELGRSKTLIIAIIIHDTIN